VVLLGLQKGRLLKLAVSAEREDMHLWTDHVPHCHLCARGVRACALCITDETDPREAMRQGPFIDAGLGPWLDPVSSTEAKGAFLHSTCITVVLGPPQWSMGICRMECRHGRGGPPKFGASSSPCAMLNAVTIVHPFIWTCRMGLSKLRPGTGGQSGGHDGQESVGRGGGTWSRACGLVWRHTL